MLQFVIIALKEGYKGYEQQYKKQAYYSFGGYLAGFHVGGKVKHLFKNIRTNNRLRLRFVLLLLLYVTYEIL